MGDDAAPGPTRAAGGNTGGSAPDADIGSGSGGGPRAEGVLDIGAVIDASGVPASTLHHWEREGLIAPVGRSGLRRQYDPTVLQSIAMVVLWQRAGLTLPEIRLMLAADTSTADTSTADVDAVDRDAVDPSIANAGSGASVDAGRAMLGAKLEALQDLRDHVTAAIRGVEHALACTAPAPVQCPAFHRLLEGVLPVDPSERTHLSAALVDRPGADDETSEGDPS